jgi:hypothetical protein
LDSCQLYGRYWTNKHTFIHSPNHVGPDVPRDMFDSIVDGHVNWYPYNGVMTCLPSVVHRDVQRGLYQLLKFIILLRNFGSAASVRPMLV